MVQTIMLQPGIQPMTYVWLFTESQMMRKATRGYEKRMYFDIKMTVKNQEVK